MRISTITTKRHYYVTKLLSRALHALRATSQPSRAVHRLRSLSLSFEHMAGVLTITCAHHVPIGTSGLDEFQCAHDGFTLVLQPLPEAIKNCKDIEAA